MKKTVVINVVGLTPHLIGEHTPFLDKWSKEGKIATIQPVLPAVTCTAQATYLTGKHPSEHGIVGNGWYFKEECEIKFWRQSNKLIQAPKIWDKARELDPSFTCANMFWWYNMYSNADYSVTPRPNYLVDGRKIPDCYSFPAEIRDKLQEKLGDFPLFNFWGPNTTIKSTRWIAEASMMVDEWYDPTLTLIYLPHLDYNYQRVGTQHKDIERDLKDVDGVCQDLIEHYEKREAQVIILSEYGITDVNHPIHINRELRRKGYIEVRREQTWELLDAGISKAFAVADHQIAHIYLNDLSLKEEVKTLIQSLDGVEKVLDEDEKAQYHLNHERAGDLIALADKNSWFTYYYWLDQTRAPDFARTVDIHRKPGYDPVELFVNPDIKLPTMQVGLKLMQKKMGFRTVMNVIPLDATLVKGSHGRTPDNKADYPLFITKQAGLLEKDEIEATQVFDLMLSHLRGKTEEVPLQ